MECFAYQVPANVFKNLRTFGSPRCPRWPLSCPVYFIFHYPLRKCILGTVPPQLPHCLVILNSDLVVLESVKLFVYWNISKLKKTCKNFTKYFSSPGPLRGSPIAPEYFFFFSINKDILLISGSQCGVSKLIASATPDNLLVMQILEPRPRPPESETLRWSPDIWILTSL